MNLAVVNAAKSTHYAVSTIAAIVYAVVWFLANAAHAEVRANANIPEIVVTAQRPAVQSDVPEVIVWGQREALEEVIVYGTREPSEKVASTGGAHGIKAKAGSTWFAQVGRWVRGAVLN